MSGRSKELEEELFKQERAKPGTGFLRGWASPLCKPGTVEVKSWAPNWSMATSCQIWSRLLLFSECQFSHLQNQDEDGIVSPALGGCWEHAVRAGLAVGVGPSIPCKLCWPPFRSRSLSGAEADGKAWQVLARELAGF